MKNIRIGNDISIDWTILRDGNPERFDGKDISVKLVNMQGQERAVDYHIERNVISIDFLGMNQDKLGCYTLLLVENANKPNMATLDKVDAFRLVDRSDKETDAEDCPQLKVEALKMESNFTIQHNIYVVDNLRSRSPKDALSANQGRVLDEKILQVSKRVPTKVGELRNDKNYINKEYVDDNDRMHNAQILAIEKANEAQDEVINCIKKELLTFVKKVNGYGLSQEDFTSAYKKKLENLKPYDDTLVNKRIEGLKKTLDTLISGNDSEGIDSFDELEKFLSGFKDSENLLTILKGYDSRLKALEGK